MRPSLPTSWQHSPQRPLCLIDTVGCSPSLTCASQEHVCLACSLPFHLLTARVFPPKADSAKPSSAAPRHLPCQPSLPSLEPMFAVCDPNLSLHLHGAHPQPSGYMQRFRRDGVYTLDLKEVNANLPVLVADASRGGQAQWIGPGGLKSAAGSGPGCGRRCDRRQRGPPGDGTVLRHGPRRAAWRVPRRDAGQ